MSEWIKEYVFDAALGLLLSRSGAAMGGVAVVAAAVYLYLRWKYEKWASAVPIVLGVASMMMVLQVGVRIQQYLTTQRALLDQIAKRPAPFDPDIIDARVQDWIRGFRWGIRPLDSQPLWLFGYDLTLTNGVHLAVIREKQQNRYLEIAAPIALTPTQRKVFEMDTQAKKDRLISDLRIALSATGVGWVGLAAPLTEFNVLKKLPIVESVTDFDFLTVVESVNTARVLANETIAQEIGN